MINKISTRLKRVGIKATIANKAWFSLFKVMVLEHSVFRLYDPFLI